MAIHFYVAVRIEVGIDVYVNGFVPESSIKVDHVIKSIVWDL